MADISVQEMFDAGAHFGHQTKKWNPKMKPYLYGTRSGLHIIDLQKTTGLAQNALNFIEGVVANGQDVLFVGTKVQIREILEDQAKRAQMPFMNLRWLGGTLTNFSTIKKSTDRMLDMESKRENNEYQGFKKKELLNIDREIARLNQTLGGIRAMRKLPGALFIVDPALEHIAVHEAKVLGIPIVAITDSNCDPDPIDYVIPANDDAIRSVHLISSRVADACLAGLEKREQKAREEAPQKQGERKPARRSKDVAATGQAYVSKPDTLDKVEAVDSYSASAVAVDTPAPVTE